MKIVYFIISSLTLWNSSHGQNSKHYEHATQNTLFPFNMDSVSSILESNEDLWIHIFNPLCSSFDVKEIKDIIKESSKYSQVRLLMIADIYDPSLQILLSNNNVNTRFYYLDPVKYPQNQRKARIAFTKELLLTNKKYLPKGKLFSNYIILKKELALCTWKHSEILKFLNEQYSNWWIQLINATSFKRSNFSE